MLDVSDYMLFTVSIKRIKMVILYGRKQKDFFFLRIWVYISK